MPELATITYEDFEKSLNQTFQLSVGDVSIEAELVGVTRSPHEMPNAKRKPFSILFKAERAFPQQIIKIKNKEFGEIDAFLVPVTVQSDDEDALFMEGIFN